MVAAPRGAQCTDVFLIPAREDFILYAPWKRVALLVNAAAADLFQRARAGDAKSPAAGEREVLDGFRRLGLFDPAEAGPPADAISSAPWRPCDVTLFLTSGCNLRCVYCYANGGESPAQMPREMMEAAIRTAADNAVAAGRKRFSVSFHGGGEPTLNWSLFTRSVQYAREAARERNLDIRMAVASNCMLDVEQVRWIATHLQALNASLDGPPEVQDAQRPTATGTGSFATAFAALEEFQRLGFPFSIRATVTDKSVGAMRETVRFLCTSLKPASIQIEPLFACGRCTTSGARPPDSHLFASQYLACSADCRERGMPLRYSGSRLETLTPIFCGAAGRNFVVLPGGEVTSCFEVCRPADERASRFFYGAYDPRTGGFAFDEAKRNQLAASTVQRRPDCTDCFLRWHCAGDCLAKIALRAGDSLAPTGVRCEINREIARAELLLRVEAQAASSAKSAVAKRRTRRRR